MSNPHVVDAVKDQMGCQWIRYGTDEQSHLFPKADLVRNANRVFGDLASINVPCLTSSSQTRLKGEVENHTEYRQALVVTQPGWLENFFVFGDGSVVAPGTIMPEVIIAFPTNPKFRARGTLQAWHADFEPLFRDQPLAIFAMTIALAGPLKRFVPPDYLNPLVEIVGQRETGKSTLGVAAASIWAGDPCSDCGGGESWALTAASIDDVKRWHRDCFLFLDEGNVGASQRHRSEFFTQAVFGLAATAAKRRYGDLPNTAQNSLSFLSTTNLPLHNVVSEKADVKDALLSRMITVRVKDKAPFGALTTLPEGHDSSRAAIEEIRAACERNYGVIGRVFVRGLSRNAHKDEDRLRRYVHLKLTKYLKLASGLPGGARIHKSFALAYAAACVAKRFGALPPSWGIADALVAVHQSIAVESEPSSDDPGATISAYIEANRADLLTSDQLQSASKEEFDASSGCILTHQGKSLLLVSGTALGRSYRDWRALLKRLACDGKLKMEGGKQPKLVTYPPLPYRDVGRVYWIWLDTKIAETSVRKAPVAEEP